jgi:hypothetical protein
LHHLLPCGVEALIAALDDQSFAALVTVEEAPDVLPERVLDADGAVAE